MQVTPILSKLLLGHLPAASGKDWLANRLQTITGQPRPRDFYLAFSACSRHLEREVVKFTPDDLREVSDIYPNFGATRWTRDQLARVLLMTTLPAATNQATLDDLFATADYHETIALYKGLYFLENAPEFVGRAREGLRTNMTGVFDAIALENPFPYAYLPEDAWNHMVLKAMFMQRPMYRIYRIEDRKNAQLADIFLDYAEERWSAHRPVSPELWRFTSGYPSDRLRAGLERTVDNDTPLAGQAARRALAETYPTDYTTGTDLPTWGDIGRQIIATQ